MNLVLLDSSTRSNVISPITQRATMTTRPNTKKEEGSPGCSWRSAPLCGEPFLSLYLTLHEEPAYRNRFLPICHMPHGSVNDERGCVSTLVSPPEGISYAGIDAALEDDGEKLYVSAAACAYPHPSVANYLTVELATLKEITQELAALFGLALPDSICYRQNKTSATV